MTAAEFLERVQIVHGTFRRDRLTVHCIIKDEMYFLPSFLDHYRSLGGEQFLFWDDGSTDGSSDYLKAQPDCVVLSCSFSYGASVDIVDAPLRNTVSRVGVLAKTFMAKKVGLEGWAIGVDADEFILLPSQFTDFKDLIASLDSPDLQVVLSSLVEFYPDRIWQPGPSPAPVCLNDLLGLYPYFDAHPLFELNAGEGALQGETASMRLFRKFEVRSPFPGYFPPSRFFRWLVGDPPRTPAHKTPLIKWSSDTFLQGNHLPKAVAPSDLLLAMAHFKFTRDLDRRTDGAIASRAYASNSLRYDCYDALIATMRKTNASFLGPQSRKFESAVDFLTTGLMRSGHVAQQEPGS